MATYSAWVRFPWNEPFIWKRFVLGFTLAAAPAMACFTQGWGIAGLLVMAIGAWPIPPRVSVNAKGLSCRWLFVEQRVPFSYITHARLEPDPRPGALVPSTVLSLGRQGGRDLLIAAPLTILQRIEHDLRSAQHSPAPTQKS